MLATAQVLSLPRLPCRHSSWFWGSVLWREMPQAPGMFTFSPPPQPSSVFPVTDLLRTHLTSPVECHLLGFLGNSRSTCTRVWIPTHLVLWLRSKMSPQRLMWSEVGLWGSGWVRGVLGSSLNSLMSSEAERCVWKVEPAWRWVTGNVTWKVHSCPLIPPYLSACWLPRCEQWSSAVPFHLSALEPPTLGWTHWKLWAR